MDHILISSTEELSPEERLFLVSSKRQEPQGEEHAASTSSFLSSDASKTKESGQSGGIQGLQRAKQKMQSVSSDSETESSNDEQDGILYQNVVGGHSNQNSNSNSLSSKSSHHRSSAGGTNPCNLSLDSNSHSTYNTLIIHKNNNSLLADTWIPASHEFTSLATGSNRQSTCSNSGKSQSPSRDASGYHSHSCRYDSQNPDSSSATNELSDIPRDYLDQLTVLKHLAKEVQQDPISGPANSKLLRSASFSRSQPDLSQPSVMTSLPVSSSHDYSNYYCPPYQHTYHQQPNPTPRKKKHHNEDGDENITSHRDDVLPSVQMLEILMRENSNLRAELANARMRIQTIHKLEAELTRLQKQHAVLFESAERRESLERTARAKLSTEVKRLTAVNKELLSSSSSLQNLSSYSYGSDVETYRKELAKKDLSFAQLVSQNKELIAAKERQDVELAAQRATLEEQRTHIDILDSALTTAQGSVVRLEEECRRNQEYSEKVCHLQRALSSLQLSNEKREQTEMKLRSQLESDITDLKLQLASKNANSNLNCTRPLQPSKSANSNVNSSRTAPPPYPGVISTSNGQPQSLSQQQPTDIAPELQILQEKLRLSEEKIQSLTSVVQRWETFFTLDNRNDKAPLTSASTPNTPNSWSSRGGTPHFFGNSGSGSSSTAALDDLPSTQIRATDLEWKIKDLESRLVEKDNILRALHFQGVTQPSQAPTNLYSSYSSSANFVPSNYMESPNFTGGNIIHQPVPLSLHSQQSPQINHQVSVSLASMMDPHRRYGIGTSIDPLLFYQKVGKCESEPPSYANLPPKLRLGGSGSSLAKNSNESLGSACLSSGNGGMSNHPSDPESVSSDGGKSKSIDEQLRELNTQLLSKGTGLKMQSGLCCIPGFSHPGPAARKGKIPQPLLEGVNQLYSLNSNSNIVTTNNSQSNASRKPLLPPLPRPPNAHGQNQNQQSVRTSSGPPFISPSGSCSVLSSTPGGPSSGLPLSNSVDSMLADSPTAITRLPNTTAGGGTVFTPVSNLPKGLPPKSPGILESSKCRSLERDQRSKSSNESGVAKLSSLVYDSSRCKSLDRRELKAQAKEKEKEEKEKEKMEKKLLKSGVSSKAAFFGGLLSRRSPSPNRKTKEKDGNESKVPVVQAKGVRFPFGKSAQTHEAPATANDQDVDTEFLDLQGRSSQRSRISKWTSSTSNLESLQENAPSTGYDSPWAQRRSGAETSSSLKVSAESVRSAAHCSNNDTNSSEDSTKKWGKIVKTPFGLRYTFGSPKS